MGAREPPCAPPPTAARCVRSEGKPPGQAGFRATAPGGAPTNPACAGCHARMDPLGFTLENFDGIGKWRTTNEDRCRSTLPAASRWHGLNGIAGLQKYLLERRHQFAVAVTEKLLTYALGRALEYSDLPPFERSRGSAANDYRWSSIIDGIVKSVPFQMSVVRSDRSGSAHRK